MVCRNRRLGEEMLPRYNQIIESIACSCIMARERDSEMNLHNFSDYKRDGGRFILLDFQVSVNVGL